MNDYKLTLNLPKTNFSMRANLIENEPKILERWNNDNLYEIVRSSKKGKKIFFLHDGPPYANGSIHIGHALNKILKDILIKFKGLSGFDTPYIPGWDCHGLPIELQVEKKYGKPEKEFTASEFRSKCREYAINQANSQCKDFVRLGVLGDWLHPYLTMDFRTEANIIRVLGKIIKDGYLHQGNKPTYWCIDCQSSLAEAEIEYNKTISPSIDVVFNALDQDIIKSKFGLSNINMDISLVIWTTTPWTLLANRGIALSPNFEYALVQIKNKILILAKNLVENTMKRVHVNEYNILSVINATELELMYFKHPFLELKVPVILGNHVTFSEGTGAVHTAGGHGIDDYNISQKYGLEIVNPVGIDGRYLPGTYSSLDGLNIFKANNIIINILRDHHALLHSENLQHNYPHCWRHKTPIIFRTTPQWFINMDKTGLRDQTLKSIKNVNWIPDRGKTRIKSMLINRPDWCISRQRIWGIPISLFVHKQTRELHPRTLSIIEYVAKYIEIRGVQAWWDLDPFDLIGDDANFFEKITDTLDVWFDSGSTYFSIITERYPEFSDRIADMYLEGSDQHRGWFMSSLIISSAIKKTAPYKQVLTHGFTVDEQGRKMSKSLGNIISPQNIINKFGSDILRLWVASTDYTNDVTISEKILKLVSNNYRRIRNTIRFLLANLNDFDPESDLVKPKKMIMLDRWAISCTKSTQENIIKAYNSYRFHEVVTYLLRFCSIEMGSFYLDIIKDRQYTTKKNSLARRSSQTALYHIIEAMSRWIAPIMSFTADEVWNYLPGKREKYIFSCEWYNNLFKLDKTQVMNDIFWNDLLQIRGEVNKVIEQWRSEKKIRSSLESVVTLFVKSDLFLKLNILGEELKFIFLTSNVKILDYSNATINSQQSELFTGMKISLNKAPGKKCHRCWHYFTSINQLEYSDICERCISNLVGNGEERKFV